jgi:hypothetical protein
MIPSRPTNLTSVETNLRPPGLDPFDALQASLVERLGNRGLSELEDGTIVVIPSISFPSAELRKITAISHYEERMLVALLLLKKPGLRVVFASCLPVDQEVIDYYLSFIDPKLRPWERLRLVSAHDPEPRALAAKLLERPDLLEALRTATGDTSRAYILPFNVTDLERDLALALGVAIWGPHPGDAWLGSKSGARKVARRAGVPVFEGAEDLRSPGDVEEAIHLIRAARPAAEAVVIKLNNGFSGQGNAIIDLRELRSPVDASPTTFCGAGESWASFGPKIAAEGAIVEELVRGAGATSPSVQMRIAPGGDFEVVSTHDQILGGPDDQVYLGCRFPAGAEYRAEIQSAARAVTGVLASGGVFGSFGMDFVVVSGRGIFLSEINLRAGGTTHPYLMARLATEGTYDSASGELLVRGQPRVYLATDNLKSDAYRRLSPSRAVHALQASGLAYDHATRTGATFHLLGALRAYGKLGVVCIGRAHDDAARQHEGVIAALDEAAAKG